MSKQVNLNTYYYKKTEIDNLLNNKANSSHTHGNITSDGKITNQASKNVVTDANGKITTEAKPTIPSANATATNIKMNGTQSAGSLASFAKADHVHPVDTSRAAASHTHSNYLTEHQDISGKENTSNKVTSISSSSTDTQYPSAKAVYTGLNGKANSSHTHDDRYYTETEVNTKLNDYLTTSSATSSYQPKGNYVTTSAIKNDLTTGGASNVLSAEQGKQLKAQIDSINNIEEILDDLLSETVVVSSKNPLIMTGDSTQLIARIYGDYSGNQTIKFYEEIDGGDDVLLSTSTTSNGVAYYDFTGEGTGERNFYAKWGSLQSETYGLKDCLVYDKGLSGSGNYNDSAWENVSYFSEFVRGTDGTTVTNNMGGNRYLTANIISGTIYDFTTPFCVEFDFKKLNSDVANTQIQMNNVDNLYFSNWLVSDGHYVINVRENEVTWTIDGQAQTPKTITLGTVFMRFYLPNGASMKFSNFMIYPI